MCTWGGGGATRCFNISIKANVLGTTVVTNGFALQWNIGFTIGTYLVAIF